MMSTDDVASDEQELFEHYRYVADPGQELLRIDKFLIDRIPDTSRNKIQEAARAGNIRVNNAAVKPNYKVRPGDQISVVLPYPVREFELIAENIPLDIVFEDDDLMVLNKPAGLVTHPGFGNFTGTLVNGLLYHFGNLPGGEAAGVRPGLVHRLDKNTSGLMVVAKSEFALSHLARQFFERTTGRTYHALVWGNLAEDQGTIEGNIGRSNRDRKVMAVFDDPEIGKPAVTHYRVLRRFNYVTLVECRLETGRTHQIRVHMQFIGHPLFNDPEYGGDRILKGTTFTKYKQFVQNCFDVCPRHALHARTLAFDHPATGERMEFSYDIPTDMVQVMEKWERYTSSSKAEHRE
jgi:23S rRNA pseudouridine1911/1915/1917 synthase